MWNVSLVQSLSRSTIQRFWVSQSELFIPDLVDNSCLISHFTWLKYIRHLALNTSKCMTLGLTVTVPPACKVLLNTSCCCLSFPSSVHNHHVLRRAQRKWHHRQVELIKQKVLFEYQLPDAAAVAKKNINCHANESQIWFKTGKESSGQRPMCRRLLGTQYVQ